MNIPNDTGLYLILLSGLISLILVSGLYFKLIYFTIKDYLKGKELGL